MNSFKLFSWPMAVMLIASSAHGALIIDWGGDYVASDTVLADGSHSFPGPFGEFSTVTSGSTLTLVDNAGGDRFQLGSDGEDYMVTWSAQDVVGAPVSFFDLTLLASGDAVHIQYASDGSVPLAKVVVQVDGSFYASTRQKQNDTPKTYNRDEIENEDPDFGLVNLTTLAVDGSGNPGTFVSFPDLNEVEAIGFLVIGNSSARPITGAEFFGDEVVPEPATFALLALGAIGLCGIRRRRRTGMG